MRITAIVLALLAACRIGFDPVAEPGPDGGDLGSNRTSCSVADQCVVEAEPGEDFATTCPVSVVCGVTCSAAATCRVDCLHTLQCVVACPTSGCEVVGCTAGTCAVTCGDSGVPTRLDPSTVVCR